MSDSRNRAEPRGTHPGPRQKVHIRIAYQGKGPPGPILRERCDRVEETLAQEAGGTLGESRYGDGTVDIYVSTREAQRTIPAAWKIINHLGLSARTTIKIADGKAES